MSARKPLQRVAFRADASLHIGAGHVMRCLALADRLAVLGAHCTFICVEQPGHLLERIERHGHAVVGLAAAEPVESPPRLAEQTERAAWLGVSPAEDARQTGEWLARHPVDWLVVDHYALDVEWERALRPKFGGILVIDDLADRAHDCDLLLDQNLGRLSADYDGLVPAACERLIGPGYALLRPEFAERRGTSLVRRAGGRCSNILVTMGGVDRDNVSAYVLDALDRAELPAHTRVSVVLGANAPRRAEVESRAGQMSLKVDVLVDVQDVAALMRDADLAIGAAGGTAWERCCMGLPSINLVLAANQRGVAKALHACGAAVFVEGAGRGDDLIRAISSLTSSPAALHVMSGIAASLVDGHGTLRVAQRLAGAGPTPEASDPSRAAMGVFEVGSGGAALPPQGTLRRMRADDLERVLAWRNHESVRAFMFDQRSIEFADHVRWFEAADADPDRRPMIFERDGIPSGFLNLYRTEASDAWEWGFYTAPGSPPRTGRLLLATAIDHVFRVEGAARLHARVLAYNHRSIRLHERFGFSLEDVLRQHHFDGVSRHDVYRYSLLSSEWWSGREAGT